MSSPNENSQKTINVGRVLVTGATGLIGRQLCLALLKTNVKLVIMGRQSENNFRKVFSLPCEYYQWENPAESLPLAEALNVDAVIHLMGEPLAGRRWSETRKKGFYTSRIDTTKNLVAAINQSTYQIKSFVTASAIGIYGEGGEEVLREDSRPANDFLANLCEDWETEAKKAKCRSVQLRFGIVLSNQGGALQEMKPIFEKGLGGPLASGRQWMSWIHIADVIEIAQRALLDPKLNGPVNVVSPEPERNKNFTKLLAKALMVRAILPAPKFALNIALGEMASVVLASQKVIPQKLLDIGYKFHFKTLKDALNSLYAWKVSRHDRLYYQRQWTSRPPEEVFDFFSDIRNLETLTPPFLNFHVIGASTETIQEGTTIDYKLKIHGIPVKWQSQITSWRPQSEFADVQIKGPYAKWHHRHLFTSMAGGVLLEDEVVYRLPLSSYGGKVLGPYIRNDISKIFNFRKMKIEQWTKSGCDDGEKH